MTKITTIILVRILLIYKEVCNFAHLTLGIIGYII